MSSSNVAVHPVNILLLVEGGALSDNTCHHPKIAGAYTNRIPFLYQDPFLQPQKTGTGICGDFLSMLPSQRSLLMSKICRCGVVVSAYGAL